MDAGAALARARELASELPAAVDAARYLEAVEAVPSDDIGSPRAEDAAFRRARAAFVSRVDAEMAWLETAAPAARQDIDAAKARASNMEIHTLAGIIEHDQDDLVPAARDLLDAKIAYGPGAASFSKPRS